MVIVSKAMGELADRAERVQNLFNCTVPLLSGVCSIFHVYFYLLIVAFPCIPYSQDIYLLQSIAYFTIDVLFVSCFDFQVFGLGLILLMMVLYLVGFR